MFNGDEDVRFTTAQAEDEVFDRVEDLLGDLGRARIDDRGYIAIRPRQSLDNAFTQTSMRGRVRQRKDGQYEVRVFFSCSMSTLGWVLLVLGVLIALTGALLLLIPMQKKDEIARKVRRTLRELEE
jgi:hypothetical protein